MWARFKEIIGELWGATTTTALAILVAAIPALQAIDAALLPLWARISIAMTGVVVAVLRVVAPPPRSVTIRKDDAVVVDHAEGTITVTKAAVIPDGIETKAAGEPTA